MGEDMDSQFLEVLKKEVLNAWGSAEDAENGIGTVDHGCFKRIIALIEEQSSRDSGVKP